MRSPVVFSRFAIPLLAVCAVFWPACTRAQAPQQPPPVSQDQSAVLRQEVNLVNVLFSVFDRSNKVVSNLSRADFDVYDDNAKQDIRFFSRQTDLPLRVGLLLDTSNSIRQRLEFEQQAAVDFLFDVIRRDKDQAFVMSVDDQPEVVQGFTSDVQLLRDVVMKQRAGGGTALYDAIYQACQVIAKSPDAASSAPGPPLDIRRVLVVISDGEDNLSRHTKAEATEMAERAGIVIYTISSSVESLIPDNEVTPKNSVERKYRKEGGDLILQQFSDDSGGRAFFPYHVDDLAVSFQRIGEELRSQYSLAFVFPHGTPDGKFHTVRLTVDAKGMQVHARRGYFATPPVPVPASATPSKPGF